MPGIKPTSSALQAKSSPLSHQGNTSESVSTKKTSKKTPKKRKHPESTVSPTPTKWFRGDITMTTSQGLLGKRDPERRGQRTEDM